MQKVTCFHDSFPHVVALELAKYRRRVLSAMRGWPPQHQDAQDFDPFDHNDAWYVVALDDGGRIDGWAQST